MPLSIALVSLAVDEGGIRYRGVWISVAASQATLKQNL